MAEDVAEGRVPPPEEPPTKKASDSRSPDPEEGEEFEESEATGEEESEEELEAEAEGEDEDEEEESEKDESDEIGTFAELAEALDQEEEALLKHLTVKVPDGSSVTLAEVVQGFLNPSSPVIQAKVQELEQAATKRHEEHQAAIQQMAQATEQIITLLNTDPELTEEALERLHEEDPQSWAVKVAEREQRRRAAENAMAVMRQRVEHEESERKKVYDEWRAEEAKKSQQLLPDWFDKNGQPSKVARRESAIMQKYLEEVGFIDNDFSLLDDHRFLIVARDAALGKARKDGVKLSLKKVRETPKANLKPGARRIRQRDSQRTIRAERAALKKSGSLEDAARVIGRLIR